jgi:hypothetical protein
MVKCIEKLNSFYIGCAVDPSSNKEGEALQLNAADFTTHAVCVGMTGSGKTGLGIALLEEAALSKIPAIIIDPKGDLGDLLLTFPDLSPEEFAPWMDQGQDKAKVASNWKEGLAGWGEDAERIRRLRESVDFALYTPASDAGLPISILSSFAAPKKEEAIDSTELTNRALSISSSLLTLLGIAADPIKSRELILISHILLNSWQHGDDLNIALLIQQIQKPPFAKIGALDVETFYPAKERMGLSISLNNLLASPKFQAWLSGEPLEIDNLLYSKNKKPKLAIISIAHLSDSERMFFVTLLLNQFTSWMRRQEGASSLRTILYMDEIFGFFPPTASPPSKQPMLTLLKQARAFGIGIILATQNPVDLDYKGLANCGTWFIGKLQTERDKARVLEGLSAASNGDIDAKTLDKMIALTGNRRFLLRSIYKKEPLLFETRWTLSYLKGPLTLAQIATLTGKKETAAAAAIETKTSIAKPMAPNGIEEYFFCQNGSAASVHYQPRILAIGKLHFVDAKQKIDQWMDICFALPVDGNDISWEKASNQKELKDRLQKAPIAQSSFEELPAILSQAKNYQGFKKAFSDALYQNQTLSLFHAPVAGITSNPGETKEEFQARAVQALQGRQGDASKKIESKYAEKIATLKARIERAEIKSADRSQKAFSQKIEAFISFCSTLLGAFMGKKVTKGTISQAGTTFRRTSRIGQENRMATAAEDEVASYKQQLQDLEAAMNNEMAAASLGGSSVSSAIEELSLHPRKSDISVEKIALLWWGQDVRRE